MDRAKRVGRSDRSVSNPRPQTSRGGERRDDFDLAPLRACGGESTVSLAPEAGEPYSVLAVDDQPQVLQLLTLWVQSDARLRLAGTASDGRSAVERAAEECPDAIICDVTMPRLGGLEALPELRRLCPGSVILMYTSAPELATTAQQLGADAVVDKTADLSALLDYVVALCRHRR